MNMKLAVVLTVIAASVAGAALLSTKPSRNRNAQPEPTPPAEQPRPPAFEIVNRPGSVNIDDTYDLTDLNIPRDEIHTLLPRDAIPALTDPKRQPIAEADWLPDHARVIFIKINDDTLAVPLNVLNYHEIVKTTVGGQPVAATYCPLCDSATVFSRQLPRTDGTDGGSGDDKPITLEFGVSGALYNSNVLMYDTTDMALWSQLAMQAASGPHAGTALDILPIQLITVEQLKADHPDCQVVTNDTGHPRDYNADPYERYFITQRLMVPVKNIGGALPPKTLGVGIATDTHAWFVSANTIPQRPTITTPLGDVTLERTNAGIVVTNAPKDVRTAQTFYYSWSAFYPNTKVITTDEPGSD